MLLNNKYRRSLLHRSRHLCPYLETVVVSCHFWKCPWCFSTSCETTDDEVPCHQIYACMQCTGLWCDGHQSINDEISILWSIKCGTIGLYSLPLQCAKTCCRKLNIYLFNFVIMCFISKVLYGLILVFSAVLISFPLQICILGRRLFCNGEFQPSLHNSNTHINVLPCYSSFIPCLICLYIILDF